LKTLHFDCFAGISGDMALGAFVDLGVDPGVLRSELGKLGVEGWNLEFSRDQRCGVTGTNAVVTVESGPAGLEGGHGDQDHHHGNPHNSWKEIRELIGASGISGGAKKRALAIFSRLAAAEAQVHGVPEDEVAFHEVGALDSVIDIVGSAVCLDILNPGRITAGEVELGGGTVTCAHGVLPVPAPATLILCRGMPVKTGGFNREMTTPTGAAILAASAEDFTGFPGKPEAFREIKTGYGIGKRKLDKPNLLRLSWRETGPTATGPEGDAPGGTPEGRWETGDLILMEADIDDMSGEALGFLMERLFGAGALDVTFTPRVMKKSRPGTGVSVLCAPEKLDPLRRTMFQESTTIGFREIPVRRLALRREERALDGGAREKTVFYGDAVLRSKIEYEDRARTARERGISLEEAEAILRGGGKG
jgi:uncharacterized protein (TIGR00299 family) protein